jgi:AcrR family transcriptional regulator
MTIRKQVSFPRFRAQSVSAMSDRGGAGGRRADSYVYPGMPGQRQPRARPRAPHQLPPGRHNLSRRFVEANQRERILDAIVDVTSLAGYSAMSVEDIIGAAGVSRRTFYDHFKSKEGAFQAALDDVSERLLERIRAALDASETFTDGVRDSLAAFLGFLAGEPRYADLLIVEVLAAGSAAIERRNELMRAFAETMKRGAERAHGRQPPELTAETLIGGIFEVVYSRVLDGRTAELQGLLPDLSYALLLPYLGDEQARREASLPPVPLGD